MKKQWIKTRRVKFASVALTLTVLTVAVVILFNAVFNSLAKRYDWQVPMTAQKNFDVTDSCYALLDEVLGNSTQTVDILFCDSPEALEADGTTIYVYRTAISLSERYPEKLRVACKDIVTNPGAVRDYANRVDITTGETVDIDIKSSSVILVSGEFHRVYDITEFFVFEQGDTDKVWGYNGERKLAAGILRAVSPEHPMVAFTNNHGELFYDYELMYLLDDAGYDIVHLDLTKEAIPEHCSLIITYNPGSDLLANETADISEIEILEGFLQKPGNSFLLFVGNGTPKFQNFEKFLSDWGISFGYTDPIENGSSQRYMIKDSMATLTSDGYTIYGEATSLAGSNADYVIFKNATSIEQAEGYESLGNGSYQKGNRTMHQWFRSGESSAAWANGKMVAGGERAMMAVTEQESEAGTSRVAVISSVYFCEEQFLQSAVYGNGDTLLAFLEEVSGVRTPKGLSLKPFSQASISMITTMQMLYWTVALIAVPVLILTGCGIWVLLRRRNA